MKMQPAGSPSCGVLRMFRRRPAQPDLTHPAPNTNVAGPLHGPGNPPVENPASALRQAPLCIDEMERGRG